MNKVVTEYLKWAKKNCKKGEVVDVFESDNIFLVSKKSNDEKDKVCYIMK